jgi:hypothetical protein
VQFVQDEANRKIIGSLATFTYAFGTTLTEEEVRIALSTANAVTYNYSGVEASMHCSYYDAAGTQALVTCTSANTAACARPGKYSVCGLTTCHAW